jgi:AraC-like DNA-binding protein
METPVGSWYAAQTFLVWSESSKLGGLVMWGRPLEPDLREILQLVEAYHQHYSRCDVVTDTRRLESVDESVYSVLLSGTREQRQLYEHQSGRHALLRAEGLVGGLTEGFFSIIGVGGGRKTFAEPSAAFEWLAPDRGAAVCDEVERIVEDASGTPTLLRRLREFLQAHLTGVDLSDAARALGFSERSLQRELHKLGTRFREELIRARIEAASKYLAELDLKIEAVAERVGMSSHSHLTSLFHRLKGLTPAQYREQQVRRDEGQVATPLEESEEVARAVLVARQAANGR